MKTTSTVFKLSTLSAAVVLAYGLPVQAENGDFAELIRPDSNISVGVGYQNNDRPQFGIYDGMRDDGGSLLLDADIKKRDDATGTWNELRINNLGLDSREIYLGHSRQGDYGISFDYSRIPRENPYTFNSGITGLGTTAVTVPTTPILPGTGTNIGIGTKRDRYTIMLNKSLNRSFEVNVKFRQEEKDGLRNWGSNATGSSNPSFLVEPIDSTTQQLDIIANYLSKALQLQGGYYGSWFKNDNSLINVNAGTAYIALPPDNEAHQLYLNGAYIFSPTTKATMRLAKTWGKQDDQSLISLVPTLAGFNGVTAKMESTEAQLGISSRVAKEVSLLANINYQDRNDKTPHIPFTSSNDETTPHDFTNLNAKVEANWRVKSGVSLLGGIYQDYRERSIPFAELNNVPADPSNGGANWTVPAVSTNEREVPYRHKDKETTYKVQATGNLTDDLNGSLAYSHSKRDGSGFLWADQQNLISPLHMADRDRDKVGVKFDWSPRESVSIQAQYAHTMDDYGTNGLNGDFVAANGNVLYGTGIRDGSAQLFSLDASFALNDKWQLNAWYSRDDTKAKQYAFQNNFGVDPIRKTDLRDVGDTLGVGVKGNVSGKLEVGADLQWTRTESQYDQTNSNDQTNLVEGLPTITNKALRLALNGTYDLDKKSKVRVDLIHERWHTNDWTWMMWNSTATALLPYYSYGVDGTTVTAKNKQTSNIIGVRYIYNFQ